MTENNKIIMHKNPIWVAGEINQNNFFISFTNRFSELISRTKEGEDITVYINSMGGETHTALGIHDLLAGCNRNTLGIVVGTAQSGASLILQACKSRMITINSTLMLHKSSVQVSGFVENAQANLDSFKELDNRFYKIYAERSGEKIKAIGNIANLNKYLTATEALDAGLVDGILDL